MKHAHEFRDPIHTFITVRTDERTVINSRPFQRLRQIHQLALTYLVYPGATHRRFEHSLGVMHLASLIFDVVTSSENLLSDSVRELVPDADALRYWRAVVRMAALCHDIGHLPFSHAAEHKLLPEGWDHERITIDLIRSPEMSDIWSKMTPPLRPNDIIKVAVGAKKAGMQLTVWETILAEIVVGDAFGADRMDYLLRDSYHAGVQYGKFDHHRLVNSLRVLPREDQGSDEPALGLEEGGLESSEALMLARHFLYSQVYLHHIRRVYDIHLVDFLQSWLPAGRFPTDVDEHLTNTDAEVIAGIRMCCADATSQAHDAARRIQERDHFKRLFQTRPSDKLGGVIQPGEKIFNLALRQFGHEKIRYDFLAAKSTSPDFPVKLYDGAIASSQTTSQVLARMPTIEVDTVYCDRSILKEAIKWRTEIRVSALNLSSQGEFA